MHTARIERGARTLMMDGADQLPSAATSVFTAPTRPFVNGLCDAFNRQYFVRL